MQGDAPRDDTRGAAPPAGDRFAFADVADRLRRALAPDASPNAALPGHDAHLTMAPSSRLDRALLSVEGKSGREAAVLVLLHPGPDGEACVVLTARPDTMRDHAGQVAFPGGRREPGETLVQTALREAHEEIGLAADGATLVGAMTPLYIPPTRFRCHPFVALAPSVPNLVPEPGEVTALLRVPLRTLFAPEAVEVGAWTVNGQPSARVPYYRVEALERAPDGAPDGGYRVWGATAMMLAELHALCTG